MTAHVIGIYGNMLLGDLQKIGVLRLGKHRTEGGDHLFPCDRTKRQKADRCHSADLLAVKQRQKHFADDGILAFDHGAGIQKHGFSREIYVSVFEIRIEVHSDLPHFTLFSARLQARARYAWIRRCFLYSPRNIK